MHRLLLVSALVVSLAACHGPGASKSEAPESAAVNIASPPDTTLATAIASTHRDAANRARDIYRHPQQTLEFFGIKPSMSVLEITPGTGWYTEILAPWLAPNGQFIGAIWDETTVGAPKYYASVNQQLRDKLAVRPDVYAKAKLITFDSNAPDFSAAGSVDAVLTFRNVHNWTMAGNDQAWFKAFFAVLKPGGVLGVVDHRANAGTTLEATKKTGYLTEEYVIGLATAAGFVLEEKSEVNANPKDTKDHPAGVWTLPPTLGLKDKDREKYLAIGESDRMTLRFRKPNDAIHSSAD
jgi:predicted methyltransferase